MVKCCRQCVDDPLGKSEWMLVVKEYHRHVGRVVGLTQGSILEGKTNLTTEEEGLKQTDTIFQSTFILVRVVYLFLQKYRYSSKSKPTHQVSPEPVRHVESRVVGRPRRHHHNVELLVGVVQAHAQRGVRKRARRVLESDLQDLSGGWGGAGGIAKGFSGI